MFVHVTANARISSLFKAKQYSIACIYHILFVHLSVHEHLGFFYLLAIVNNAAMNISVQISVWVPAFILVSIYP